jgi:hypothetical protein
MDANFNDSPTFRFRYDDESDFSVRMHSGSGGDSAFFPDPNAELLRLRSHNRLSFGFTQISGSFGEASFNLEGFNEAAEPVLENCGLR